MHHFWEATEEDPYKLDSVTEDMIKHTENRLNIILPESYKKLILKQNGGMINYNAFPTTVQNSWAEDHIEFDYLLGLGEDPGIRQFIPNKGMGFTRKCSPYSWRRTYLDSYGLSRNKLKPSNSLLRCGN